MSAELLEKEEVTIVFAGDSGDGMQLTGSEFTNTAALVGNDLSTFPNFPAEIRAPQGTVAGVSGFQIKFGSINIYTPGDECDVLVVMNSAALKSNIQTLKKGGIIIANTDGFDSKNLRLAKYEKDENPLEDGTLADYSVYKIDVTKLTKATLADTDLGTKLVDRSKNMFVLGFVYWMYNRPIESTVKFLSEKFIKKPEIAESNIKVLKAGYNYADTTETFTSRFSVKAADMAKGSYRNIMGNQATAMGLICAANKANKELFYGTYPITPASDILHELSRHKNYGVATFQAEDEIAAVCSAIGASFGGSIGVTASSGPGIALKGEGIGLAMILELPLVIINVQRGGPATGLPTKTEQADLLQAFYGRNGECPVPIVCATSPSDCFHAAYTAVKMAIEHMTPVFLLTDGYIANGSEPWKYPTADELREIKVTHPTKTNNPDGAYLPYKRDEKLVREWALPGTAGLEHRIGGLEKQNETGNVSYDSDNHEFMVKIRAAKVAKIAEYIPEQKLDSGETKDKVLVLGWGSTYGAIKTAVKKLRESGESVAHAQITYLNPLPKNLGALLASFDKIVIPEMNNGQLDKIIKSEFLLDVIPLNKIKGMPFTAKEIERKVREIL